MSDGGVVHHIFVCIKNHLFLQHIDYVNGMDMMMVAAASQGALQQPGMVPPMPGQAYMNPASQYPASLAQYVTSTSQYVTAPAPPHYVTSSHHHPVIFYQTLLCPTPQIYCCTVGI